MDRTDKTKAAEKPPRSRRRRWSVHLIQVGIVAVAVWAAVQWLVLPWLVRQKVTAALTDLGLRDVRFDVAVASFWGTRLADVEAAGGVRVAAVDVRFRPLAAASGELDSVTVTGAVFPLSVRDGKLGTPIETSSEGGQGGWRGIDVPFARLELASATLHVNFEGQPLSLPVNGSLVKRGPGAADVTLSARLPAADVRVGGATQLRGFAGVLHLKGDVEPAGATVSLAGETAVSITGARVGSTAPTRVDAVRLVLESAGDGPLARYTAADGRVTFAMQLRASEQVAVAANGWLAKAADARGLSGDVRLVVPRFRVDDDGALAELVSAARGFTLSGTFAADARVTIDDGTVRPDVTLIAADAAFASVDWDLSAEGVNGRVVLAGLSPLTTPAEQTITASRARVGKLNFVDGSLRFRVDGPRAIVIEQTRWGWAGGTLRSGEVRIDPANPVLDFVAYGEGLRVGEILSALGGEGRFSGRGRMFGKIPVRVDWPSVTLGTGYLYSVPGVTGTLRVTDTELVGKLLDESDPRFVTDREMATVKRRLLRALTDFEYDAFRVNFDRSERGGLAMRMFTSGKGRVPDRPGETPQEVSLTVNVTGVQDLIDTALVLKRGWDRTQDALGEELGK